MYKGEGGFAAALEKLDPSAHYDNTDMAGLDAFQRQLKRFDIKVGGMYSDSISKFFKTADSAALFPEYVSRAVAQGTKDASILGDIIASKTNIASLDYRSITTDINNKTTFEAIAEGGEIPVTNITLNENLVKLKKRGRLLSASYEAIKYQRVDVFTVALRQIGVYISKAQLRDAIDVLITGGGSAAAAEKIQTATTALAYDDLLKLWNKFEDFEMNVMLCSPDMAMSVLSLSEFKDPHSGAGFQNTGAPATPMGAKLMKSSVLPERTIIALDKRFALEMVCAGDITVDYDSLINTQLERAAVTSIYGFSKIFPDAVKVLERKS
jgi:hypothetical protein